MLFLSGRKIFYKMNFETNAGSFPLAWVARKIHTAENLTNGTTERVT